MNDRRVVITGMGVVTPLGNSVETFWSNLRNGVSGISIIDAFDTSGYDCKIGGQIRDFDPKQFFKNPKDVRRTDRFTHLAMAAAKMALADSGIDMNAPDIQTAASRWVDDHGECLYRYALVRVRKPEVAEDLVQETFLAAVRGYDKFGGRSSERSWLVGILKNKIVDRFRKLGRETSFTDMEFLSDELSEKFVSIGFWNHDLGPHEWKPEPDAVMHRAEFWQVMGDCLSKLPEKIRAVFTMREMDEVPSKEICAVLSISDSNLWVMLHRARMALRECLEMNWFDTPAGGTV